MNYGHEEFDLKWKEITLQINDIIACRIMGLGLSTQGESR
jgi:hypothetical protein